MAGEPPQLPGLSRSGAAPHRAPGTEHRAPGRAGQGRAGSSGADARPSTGENKPKLLQREQLRLGSANEL